jgi:hypothetical protein
VTDDYFAGLFDGEGWFSIARNNGLRNGGRREYQYQCCAALVVRQREVIEILVERYGGRISRKKPAKANHNEAWQWTASGNAAMDFAIAMNDKLLIKHKQAALIVMFQSAKNAWGPKGLSDEQYMLYGDFYSRMKELNVRGVQL